MSKSSKKLKTLSELKKKMYWGFLTDIALEGNIHRESVKNVFKAKTKNELLIHSVRLSATKVLEKRSKRLSKI